MKSVALLQGVIAVIIFGTLPATIKFVHADPFTLGIFRLAISILFLLPIVFKSKTRINRADFKVLLLIGICFGLHWLTYFYSIRISSASIGALGVATFGVHLLILGAIFLKTKFKLLDLLAVFIALFGCVLLIPTFTLKDNNTLGLLLSVFSGFLYALLPIFHKRIIHLPTLDRTFYQFAFALLIFVPFAGKSNWNLNNNDWLGMLYLATVCTVVAHSLWVKATTELNPITSSIIYYGYVPISLFLNNLVLHESLTFKSYVGVFLILSANVIAFLWGSYSGAKK